MREAQSRSLSVRLDAPHVYAGLASAETQKKALAIGYAWQAGKLS